MAQRKIIWSHKAQIKLTQILQFYIDRNNSNIYSVKLYKQFQKNIKLLQKQPYLGIRTDISDVRSLIMGEFIIFYEVTEDLIIIHTLWDCRQNPEDLNIK